MKPEQPREFPLGSRENPCTAENSTAKERSGKFCCCVDCRKVGLCSPTFDYYETDESGLHCESCFRETLEQRGIKASDLANPENN